MDGRGPRPHLEVLSINIKLYSAPSTYRSSIHDSRQWRLPTRVLRRRPILQFLLQGSAHDVWLKSCVLFPFIKQRICTLNRCLFVLCKWPLAIVKTRTVWKFHGFSITQILSDFKFCDSKSAKSAILTHLEVLNFAF